MRIRLLAKQWKNEKVDIRYNPMTENTCISLSYIKVNKYRKSYLQYTHDMAELKKHGCCICSYNKCQSSLHFHHVNPEDKEFGLITSTMSYKLERIMEEFYKCTLLCANCHGEITYVLEGNK